MKAILNDSTMHKELLGKEFDLEFIQDFCFEDGVLNNYETLVMHNGDDSLTLGKVIDRFIRYDNQYCVIVNNEDNYIYSFTISEKEYIKDETTGLNILELKLNEFYGITSHIDKLIKQLIVVNRFNYVEDLVMECNEILKNPLAGINTEILSLLNSLGFNEEKSIVFSGSGMHTIPGLKVFAIFKDKESDDPDNYFMENEYFVFNKDITEYEFKTFISFNHHYRFLTSNPFETISIERIRDNVWCYKSKIRKLTMHKM